jgi:phytoene dehydrogenase-like protein
VVRDLGLENQGLRWLESPAVVNLLQLDGSGLTLWREVGKAAEEIAAHSKSDAEKYPDFLQSVGKYSGVLKRMMLAAPPLLPQLQAGELLPWLSTVLKVRTLGDREMMEFLRVLPMPAADWLGEWFQSEPLKAAIGAGSVLGQFAGPMSSGTSFLLLYHAVHAGSAGFRASRFVKGGVGRLSEALAAAARRSGAEIITEQPVSSVILEDGRAVGIRLGDGLLIKARVVISNADPRRTFFNLVGAANLPVGFVREVKNIRLRSSMARVSLALNRMPNFPNAGESGNYQKMSGHNLICPGLEYMEQAFDEAKYGRFSSQPVLDFVIPTMTDSTLAPPGMHLMLVDAYYAPYELRDGSWEEMREAFLETVIEMLSAYAPDIRQTIAHQHIMTPIDMESELGLTGGDIYHGQMGLDQLLMMRPAPGCGRYRTSVENLYLCGAGTHPGGGVTGAPGYNAAKEILRDLRKLS